MSGSTMAAAAPFTPEWKRALMPGWGGVAERGLLQPVGMKPTPARLLWFAGECRNKH